MVHVHGLYSFDCETTYAVGQSTHKLDIHGHTTVIDRLTSCVLKVLLYCSRSHKLSREWSL